MTSNVTPSPPPPNTAWSEGRPPFFCLRSPRLASNMTFTTLAYQHFLLVGKGELAHAALVCTLRMCNAQLGRVSIILSYRTKSVCRSES